MKVIYVGPNVAIEFNQFIDQILNLIITFRIYILYCLVELLFWNLSFAKFRNFPFILVEKPIDPYEKELKFSTSF